MDEMRLQLEVLYKILMLDFHKFYRREKGSYNLTIKKVGDAVIVTVDWNENKDFVKFQFIGILRKSILVLALILTLIKLMHCLS